MTENATRSKYPLPEEDWDAVPSDVRVLHNWGVYDVNGNRRPTSVVTGCSKGWNKPEHWTDFEGAFEYCEANSRYWPGFFFSRDNQVVGVDIDACRNPANGELEAWAIEIIDSCNTYTEVSLSGTGVKLLGESGNWKQNKGKIVHVLEGVPQHGKHTPQIDIRFSGSFFGLTGCVIRRGFRNFGDVVLPMADRFLELREANRSSRWTKREKLPHRKAASGKQKKRGSSKLVAEFNRLISIATVLRQFGWQQIGDDHFRRPGKTGGGHSATTKIGNDGVERIAFWTSEAEPFETSEADFPANEYSAFDCWRLLRFSGDFGPAIRAWENRLRRLVNERRRAK